MSNLRDIFSNDALVGAKEQQSKGSSELYKVSYKEGKNNIYKSIIRFLPNPADPTKCIMEKQVSWVKNIVSGKGMYIDDPRTRGEFSPITDMFFRFYNTGNDTYKKYAKDHLSSKIQYASLVQIIQDEQHPELQGQIKVFIYGKKIWEKLHSEQYPAMGTGINPFHPIYGRYFQIYCQAQSGFNNFDQSGFIQNTNGNQIIPTGMYYLNSASGKMEMVTETSNQDAVGEWLVANAPDLTKYDYQPWTEEQTNFVNEVINISSNYLANGTVQTNMQTLQTPQSPVNMQPVAQPSFPGITPEPTPQSMQAMPQAQPAREQNSFSGMNFSMGSTSMNPTPMMNPTPGAISGMPIPNVNNPQPTGQPNYSAGIGGDIDEILNGI